MTAFFEDLAEQVPEAKPGDLALAVGRAVPMPEDPPAPPKWRRNWRDSHSKLSLEQRTARLEALRCRGGS